MARRKRNKRIKAVDMKNFVLSVIKEAEGRHIKSAEICKRAKEHFDLSSSPNDSMVRSMVNALRMKDGHWQLTATTFGYVWSDNDKEYRAWKSRFESQINTMIRCLHTIESAYVRDVNEYIVKKGFKPSAECMFNFFPFDLDWSNATEIHLNLTGKDLEDAPKPSQPLKKISPKRPAKRKSASKRRGSFLKYVKTIRKEGEPWKDAISRAKKNWGPSPIKNAQGEIRGSFFAYVNSIRKEGESWQDAIQRARKNRGRGGSAPTASDKPNPPNDKGPSSLFKRITKNFGLSKDEE